LRLATEGWEGQDAEPDRLWWRAAHLGTWPPDRRGRHARRVGPQIGRRPSRCSTTARGDRNAACGTLDASYPYEDKLIAAYVKLEGVAPVDIVYVDRGGSSGLFEGLQAGEDSVRRLADAMSQVIRPGGVSELKVDAKRFLPPSLPAVLWNPEATRGQMRAREILDDPHSASSLREMAEDVIRNSRRSGMRMTINAACPFIVRLAQQDFRDPEIIHIMLGVYNSAILYNAELLTATNAKIFHDQFGTLLERTVEHLAERQQLKKDRVALEAERRALAPNQPFEQSAAHHRIFFLRTPFKGYETLEDALRVVIEDHWGCQLFLARDRVYSEELLGNVLAHMAQADAFVAEVSMGNANVMFELGAARSHFHARPTILLAHPSPAKDKVELPADLGGLLRLEYALGSPMPALADHLETELRKNHALAALLDDSKRERFVSTRRLRGCITLLKLPEDCLTRLVERFPTSERWEMVKVADVAKLLSEENVESYAADLLLKQIRKGLRQSGAE
jgi:hypothetical protein